MTTRLSTASVAAFVGKLPVSGKRCLSSSTSIHFDSLSKNERTPDHHVEDKLWSEISRYPTGIPIEKAHTPPSSWYTDSDIFQLEMDAIFLPTTGNSNADKWVAVDVFTPKPGAFKTGTFLGQPYLLTCNNDGIVQAFYNICTHMGSCLVGPWTNKGSEKPTRLSSSLVGKSTEGCLVSDKNDGKPCKHTSFQCPYHGWQFNVDGRLTKATHVKGIQNFRAKDFSLKPIPLKQVGPIVFLNFGGSNEDNDNASMSFDSNLELLFDRLQKNGFVRDLSNLRLVKTKQFTVQCNWKVFCDNYGDGCYHCSFAHVDLASNIDEANYSTEILSSGLSIQQAPPSLPGDNNPTADERFGTKTAVYAQWYPNIMLNRYGPWLDLDIVIPVDATTSTVIKAWFLEDDYSLSSDSTSSYIETSLESSEQVHDEDVFLCENVQRGMQSRGYDSGRYVPSKQIASYHFHQKLARDLRQHLS